MNQCVLTSFTHYCNIEMETKEIVKNIFLWLDRWMDGLLYYCVLCTTFSRNLDPAA